MLDILSIKKPFYAQFKLWIKYLIPFILQFLIIFDAKASSRECVILLHGLGRTHHSLSSIEDVLKQRGYIVVNEDYPSRNKSIENIANENIPLMIDQCSKKQCDHINFVTHSMGGIIVRQYLQNHQIPNLSRIVMLAPPNHGSQLADILHNNWLFKYFMGPAGQELTTFKTSIPNKLNQLEQHQYQVGVIAGNFSFIPFNHGIFNEENDGLVSVSSTRIKHMKDFILLPVGHTFIMRNPIVLKEILFFLEHGNFIHALKGS